jgi:hypothetical protein
MQDEVYQAVRCKVGLRMAAMAAPSDSGRPGTGHRIRKRERDVADRVRGICDGGVRHVLATSLATAEADLEKLLAKRATETPQVIRLPVDLRSIYRAHVVNLTASLSHDAVLTWATDALGFILDRGFIRSDPAAWEALMEIGGNLAGLQGRARGTGQRDGPGTGPSRPAALATRPAFSGGRLRHHGAGAF